MNTERRKVISDPPPWVAGLSEEEKEELGKKDRAKLRPPLPRQDEL